LAGYVVGLGPEVVSKALWKELSAYRRGVPIQGSSTPPNRGFASMSTSLRLPQTCGPLAQRNPAPNVRTIAASERPFVASQIGPFRGLRQEFPICGKGQVGTAGRPESLGAALASTRLRKRDALHARRFVLVHVESLGIDHRDARSRGIPVVPRGDAGRSLRAHRVPRPVRGSLLRSCGSHGAGTRPTAALNSVP